mmetsp:Transcript_127904/g.368455  ORF Transcript_127904/g.368455 Transcript_127904/m.368455 type:complete len:582 (-) Transcript_127904:98-1843(-)
MGCGSSKATAKETAVPHVRVAPPEETPASATVPEDEPADFAEVNPWDFVVPGQQIIYSASVWKLNHGASPHQQDEWLRRKMWLTDCGGLFYYSHQFRRPVGRSVATLNVRVTDDKVGGRFIFELKSNAQDDALALARTMLAVENEAERDAWVNHLRQVGQAAEEGGATGSLDPLEPLVGKIAADRRRLSQDSAALLDSSATDRSGRSAARPSSHAITPLASNLSENSTFAGQVKSSKTLRMSLHAGLVEHCKNLSVSGFIMSDTGQRPSFGPNAFLEKGFRPSAFEMSEKRAPMIRRDSQSKFAQKDHAFIVLDWDDTLFPTTFIRQDCGLDWRLSIAEQVKPGRGHSELVRALDNLATKVEAFVDLACAHGHVVIVTLAKRPWVQTSMANFMPRLQHSIEVVYAREKITDQMRADYAKLEFKSTEQEIDFWMRAKAEAMSEQLQAFHKTTKSWKNLLSFGDGEFERIAMITNAERWLKKERVNAHVVESGLTSELISQAGHRQRLRTKTVKMLDEPALEEMLAQLELLHTWLPHLVKRDRGIDIVLEDSEDDTRLRDLDQDVTGERRPRLTWRRLAGIDG